ncbi:hypothetical protein B0H34DRAFT_209156 [Crassisporium funariophilum]|nr:hypothetical protein B0H34DRAFT_209156 [Crassisporium funariophilum]
MFNLSLSRSFSGWIRPSRTPNGLSIDDTATGVFAAELLDRITDHLHDDRPTLLRLGITCRQTLIRSRLLLFAKLEFTKGDEKQFDMFLALLEAPWTSFTNAVESLHLQEMFYTSHIFLPKKNLPRILAHLPNLQTIRLSRIIWARIPSHIRDFTSQINITDLVLESVAFPTYQTGKNNIVELFSGLQPSLKSITLYNLQFDDNFIPDLSQHSSIFRRRIHLKLLDTTSLLLLKDVWDPLRAKDLDITVDSFHVRLVHMTRSNVEAYTAFFSRFLRQVGPSLHHVFIKLTEQYLGIRKPTFQILIYH